ncbi:MAG: hypothetical protein H0W34_10895 [Pyrinomonadaceae bacterium]|nr:hypothetical protein [Pyrinomonadaceae bacterium]
MAFLTSKRSNLRSAATPSDVPREVVVIANFTGIDVFSPIRSDWRDGTEICLRQANHAK